MTYQVSTHQVPCGPHSLIHEMRDLKAPQFAVQVYLYLNYHSDWDTGETHAKSLLQIAKDMGVYKQNKKEKWTGKSRVANALKWLRENGWIITKRRNGLANTYRLIHHNCEPHEVPLDEDDRPKKCATPRGEGSAFEKMMAGDISWRACLMHTVAKVLSDWTSGAVKFTIKTARKWLRFSRQAVCDLRKELLENGLLEEIGNRARGFAAKILPLPYEKRRKRREWKALKGMKCDEHFYYSYNGKWRICRVRGDFQTREETKGSGWRFANEYELERVNPKIYRDFMGLRGMILSLAKFREHSEI